MARNATMMEKKNKGAAGEERTAGAVSASCMEEQNDFSGDDDDDAHNRSDAQTRGFNNLAGQSFWFDSEANSPQYGDSRSTCVTFFFCTPSQQHTINLMMKSS